MDTKRFLSEGRREYPPEGDIQVTGKMMGRGTSMARGKDGEKHRNRFCEIRRN